MFSRNKKIIIKKKKIYIYIYIYIYNYLHSFISSELKTQLLKRSFFFIYRPELKIFFSVQLHLKSVYSILSQYHRSAFRHCKSIVYNVMYNQTRDTTVLLFNASLLSTLTENV